MTSVLHELLTAHKPAVPPTCDLEQHAVPLRLLCCHLQEGALTALASVADCAQEQFVRYYDAVMPLLSQILHNAQNKEHR
jgi:hypothetical protein